MFTKPKYGWTEIHLEDFEGLGQLYAGHPCFCVKKGVQSVQEWTPLELWFDEEGSAFTLTADEETKSSQRVNSVRRNTILSALSWI